MRGIDDGDDPTPTDQIICAIDNSTAQIINALRDEVRHLTDIVLSGFPDSRNPIEKWQARRIVRCCAELGHYDWKMSDPRKRASYFAQEREDRLRQLVKHGPSWQKLPRFKLAQVDEMIANWYTSIKMVEGKVRETILVDEILNNVTE